MNKPLPTNQVVTDLRKLEKAVQTGRHYGFQQDIWTRAADEIDRLQSALTESERALAEARRELEDARHEAGTAWHELVAIREGGQP